MSERERPSRPPTSARAPSAPKRAPTEIGLDLELGLYLDDDLGAAWPRSSSSRSPSRASPTRSGTLRWGEFARALAERSPTSSPVRGGTLKWAELAAARVEEPASPRKSPVRSGTLKWGDLMAQLPPVLAPEPPSRQDPSPPRDSLPELKLDETLAPLLSAGLVRRGGRNVARRRGFDDRRDPTEPPPGSERAGSSPDLATAIQEALEDDE